MNNAGPEARIPAPRLPATQKAGVHVCRCGQDLDTNTSRHCPRGGTALPAHADAR